MTGSHKAAAKATSFEQSQDGQPLTALGVTFRQLPPETLSCLLEALKKQWKFYRKAHKECQNKFSEPAVHDSRVAVRRLLSLIDLLTPYLAAGQVEKAARSLKRHLDIFGDLRDAQVQLLTIDKLKKRFPAVDPLEAYLHKREKTFQRRTRKCVKRLKTRALGRLMKTFREHIGAVAAGISPARAGLRVFQCLQSAFVKTVRMQAQIDPHDTRTIHRTRLAFRRYRYMVEVVSPLVPGNHRRLLSSLHAHQTVMGDIQDAEVLLEMYDEYLEKKPRRTQEAAKFRAELLRRRDLLISRYLDHANELFKFSLESGGSSGAVNLLARPRPAHAAQVVLLATPDSQPPLAL